MPAVDITFSLDESSVDALYDAFDSINCSTLEPDFNSFDDFPLPIGCVPTPETDEISYVIVDVQIDTVDGVRGIWATMRPYLWDAAMQVQGASNGSLNAKPKFRLAVIEGPASQSVLFARKKLLAALEDTILTWEACEEGVE